jgi:hypothetical protein
LQNIAVIHNHDESFHSNRKGFSGVAVVVTDVRSDGRFVVVDLRSEDRFVVVDVRSEDRFVVVDVRSEDRFVVVDIVDIIEELFVRVRQQQVLRLLRLRGIPRLRSDPSHAHAT